MADKTKTKKSSDNLPAFEEVEHGDLTPKELGWTIIKLVVVIGVVMSIFHYNRTHPGYRQETAETLYAYPGKWTHFSTDEDKETTDLTCTESKTIDWQMVINNDFAHPIGFPAGTLNKELGKGIRDVDFALAQRLDRPVEFILKRHPK